MESSELVQRILNSDTDALAEFIELQRPRLVGFVSSIIGDHLRGVVESDDLVQEIAVSAIAALPRLPKEDLDIQRWLDQLARRRVVDAHRHHFGAAKRSVSKQRSIHGAETGQDGDLEQLLIASITSPSSALSRDIRLQRIQIAMEKLSDAQRGILQLRYGDGLPTKEIAELSGKSDGATRVLLTRAIQRLQQLVGVTESSQYE